MEAVSFLGQRAFFCLSYHHPALEIMLMIKICSQQHKPILCYCTLMSDILAFQASKHHMPRTIKQESRENLLLTLLNTFAQVNTKAAEGLKCG